MSLKLIKIILICSIFSFISCSGEPPQVLEVWSQLNLTADPETGETVQSLSLFLHAEDEDGDDDLESLFLINDDYQLVWEIEFDQWEEYTDQGILWIGVNGLLAPGDGVFPEGDYRILLIDLGGERDERPLYLRNNIPAEEDLELPEISFDNQFITIKSDFLKFQFWFYETEGTLVEKSRDFLPGKYQWNEIVRNINRRASSFSVYTEPESGSWGLISGPHYFSN